ncbi:hypothetical protein ATANTOWER_026856 [Ataeniobius toweri]|uniref:Uncharacterized protein n=1 Tax=Ataeniobius toweri TaxID=208326 RepID=A0ABU7ATL5_9TELE|nr:hypothetical protein [Ataeniobius toweri]
MKSLQKYVGGTTTQAETHLASDFINKGLVFLQYIVIPTVNDIKQHAICFFLNHIIVNVYLCSLQNKTTLPYWKNDSGEPSAWQNGWHGYDNEFLDMRGFFLAAGPAFLNFCNWVQTVHAVLHSE